MNTKNNKRRRESIARMENAFIHLLQTQELSKITVSDVCKLSGLNRSTFYANFTDIFDLADRIREHLEQEVQCLYEEQNMQDFNRTDFRKLFHHIQGNQMFYITYFKLGYDRQSQMILHDLDLAQEHIGDTHIDYHLEFFRAGFNAVIKKWLAGGCRESPEEMVEIIRNEYHGRTMKSTV